MKKLCLILLFLLTGCQTKNYYYEDPSGYHIEVRTFDFATLDEKNDLYLELPDSAVLSLGSSVSRMDPNSVDLLSEAIVRALKGVL